MTDRDDNPDGGRAKRDPSGNPSGDNTEWMQDQTGEDHNLSGSDTYRTLPDQPAPDAEDEGARDTSNRQSNR